MAELNEMEENEVDETTTSSSTPAELYPASESNEVGLPVSNEIKFVKEITLKPSSYKLYQAKINKLKREGVTDFNDTENVMETIKLITTNIQTQKSYLQAIARLMPDLPKIQVYKDKLSEIYQTLRNTHTLTTNQQKSFLPWTEILEKRDKYKEKIKDSNDVDDWKRLLIISLWTYIPPRRSMDFFIMFCYAEIPDTINKKINYYIKSEKLFVFNNYKTSHLYGTQEVEIPDELFEIITKYTTMAKVRIGHTLLGFTEQNSYSKYVGDVFQVITKKRITPNILRHSWSMHRDEQGRTAEEVREDAELMSHTVEQEIRYVKHKIRDSKIK